MPEIETENKCPKCKATLIGRHCLTQDCGYSGLRPEDLYNNQLCNRDRKALPYGKEGKLQRLIEVMRTYGISLPANAHEWRVPSEPESGYILGITRISVRLLCTDGILGWFTWDDGSVILGHMQRWKRDKEPGEKAKSKRTKLLDID